MKKKRLLTLLAAIISVIFAAALSFGCSSEGDAVSDLKYTLSGDGTYYICSGYGNATEANIVIASKYKGLPVKSIGSEAFRSCTGLTSVTIPDSVTSIGDRAFYNCT